MSNVDDYEDDVALLKQFSIYQMVVVMMMMMMNLLYHLIEELELNPHYYDYDYDDHSSRNFDDDVEVDDD